MHTFRICTKFMHALSWCTSMYKTYRVFREVEPDFMSAFHRPFGARNI